MNIKYINPKQLKFAEYNPRKISDHDMQQLKKSITDFGFVDPIIVNQHQERENIIIGGHQRVKAALALKYDKVPVYYLSLDHQQEKELNVRLNKNTGEWDWDLLEEYYNKEDLLEWGFEDYELEWGEVNLEAEEDDYEIPEDLIIHVNKGDLIEIGEHRLFCGDALEESTVKKLMNNSLAVLAFNDPPYGMKKESEGVTNDNLNESDLLKFNQTWIDIQFKYITDNGSFYCWGTDTSIMDIYSNIIKSKIKNQECTFRNIITWDKGTGQGQMAEGFRMYPIADEKCLFIMKGVQGFNNNADNYFEGWESIRDYLLKSRLEMGWDVPTMKKIVGHSDLSRDHWTSKSQFNFPTEKVYKALQDKVLQVEQESEKEYNAFKKEYNALKKEYNALKKEYYSTRSYFNNTHDNMNNVWKFKRTQNSERLGNHATPKPLELCERAIKTSSNQNDIIVDFFIGSGSTMVACHQLNRICYGIEIEPHYCQVIIDRMLKLDENIEVKINGKPYNHASS